MARKKRLLKLKRKRSRHSTQNAFLAELTSLLLSPCHTLLASIIQRCKHASVFTMCLETKIDKELVEFALAEMKECGLICFSASTELYSPAVGLPSPSSVRSLLQN